MHPTTSVSPADARRAYDELLTDSQKVGWLRAALGQLLDDIAALNAAPLRAQTTPWHTLTRHAAFLRSMLGPDAAAEEASDD